ncbi:MAG TPA: threonyl-tRNA synthetase editing domain-containing protein [Bacteroidales bacterium]|nr:threonyl-tRNA synthetase editing domain-containing protein [Bacteroidales bacterium]
MKILFIYCENFGYNPTIKTVDEAPENSISANYNNVQVAFIQVEEEDVERVSEVEKKLIKNLKWVCGKNEAKTVILHSFAHLSDSKAEPEFTRQLLTRAEERMANAGYTVHQTPFGYFLDLHIDAPGFSLARIFKSI